MAEYAQLENLSDSYLGESSQSDAVSKFIHGEISLGDYLQQMGNEPSESEVSSEMLAPDVPSIDTLSIGTLDDIELSASSASGSENDDTNDPAEGRRKSRKSDRKRRPRRSKLSITLKAVMGQANVCYAKGDAESAVRMCFEIMKEEPNASEPFRLLSNIYEANGEAEKSLQMRLLAAHLGPTDKEEWIQLAAILKAEGRYRQAAACYSRAIQLDGSNIALYENRIELIKLGQLNTHLEDYGYQRLLHKLDPKTDGPTVMRIRNFVGTLYFQDKKYAKACEIWEFVFKNCKELITKNEIDKYTDALMYAEKYEECLSVLQEFCGISVTKIPNDVIDIEICNVISTDTRIKLTMCLVQHQAYDLAKHQIEVFLRDDINPYTQFCYNIAAKLVQDEMYRDALLIWNKLTRSKMNSSDIWFQITQCHKNLDELDECFESYRTAIKLFPDDNELKLRFCNELRAAGLYEEAVEVTFKNEAHVSQMIYERCQLYHLLGDNDSFIEAAWQLFRLHCIEIQTADDFTLFQSLFHRSAKGMKEKLSQRLNKSVDNSVPVEDEWEVFLKVGNIYLQRKDYDLFQHLASSLCLSFKFISKRLELRYALILACIYNQDYEMGFDLTRQYLLLSEVPKRAWNLFHLASYRTDYSRLHKFLMRLLIKNPNDDNALMLYANSCLIAGTYKYALNDYSILSEKYGTPLLAFMIALNLLHIACQKFTTSKHALVTQMLAFFTKYQELRGSGAHQEVFYNIGRAFHQLELLPQAISYYKKALECKPAVDDPAFDLTPDIGYNLHVIYMHAGQVDLAKAHLQKYVVI